MKNFLYTFLVVSLLTPFAFLQAAAIVEVPPKGGNGFLDFNTSISTITGFINTLIVLLIGVAVLVFIWGLLKYVSAGGDEDKIKEARNTIIMGIVVIFVMTSVWGLVRILKNTFRLKNTTPTNAELPHVPGRN